jgi:hypothetical protein
MACIAIGTSLLGPTHLRMLLDNRMQDSHREVAV